MQRYLKRTGEWYAVQQGATQSYDEAPAAGYFRDKVKQEWAGETNTENERRVFDAGVYCLLPLLVRSEWRVANTGQLRLQLERHDLP